MAQAQQGNYELQKKLNIMTPAFGRMKFGDHYASMIAAINGLLAKADATGAAAAATVTQTFGGTITAGNAYTTTITNAAINGLPVTISDVVVAGDTTTTIAARQAAKISANSTLKAAGITASSSGAILTVSQPGTIGNSTVVTGSAVSTLTSTIANSGAMAGGTGTLGSGNVAALAVKPLSAF